jgi:hypothetical protein
MWYKIKKIYLWEDLVWPKPAAPVQTVWAYWNQDLWLISLVFWLSNWAPNPRATVTIADKNLGATTVRAPGDTVTAANAGNFFQWWNNYGFPYNGTPTTSSTLVDASAYWPSNPYSNSTFRTVSGNVYADWSTDHNQNLWWGSSWTYSDRQWPCPAWYHIPSVSERETINLFWWNSLWWRTYTSDKEYRWSTFFEYLKLPCVWYYNCDGRFVAPSAYAVWHYWTSNAEWATTSTAFANYALANTRWDMESALGKIIWWNIRPFKNTVVIPDATWVKLWPTS